ncbi:unnamed protein product [Lasius platythorax]|uniref:Uncharacterized protein n=1 Tax=Lasius platythorax TaxID=488582 RepID=A0AAV2NQK9_9HYME
MVGHHCQCPLRACPQVSSSGSSYDSLVSTNNARADARDDAPELAETSRRSSAAAENVTSALSRGLTRESPAGRLGRSVARTMASV